MRMSFLGRMLSDRAMTCSEIAERLGQARGGGLSEILNDLCEAGFLASDAGVNPETGKSARQGRYRLRDNYTRFFLRYVEPNIEKIRTVRYGLVYDGHLSEVVRGNAFFDALVSSRELLGLQS